MMAAGRYKLAVAALVVFGGLLTGGCKSSTTSSEAGGSPQRGRPAQGTSATDPCPERLHDLAGAILNFLVQYDRLPPTLEDLKPVGGTTLELTCPASGQKYIYTPNAIKLPPGRWAIVYDSAPVHSGMRWVIVFSPGKDGQPPVPAVIAITEAEFKAATELPGLSK